MSDATTIDGLDHAIGEAMDGGAGAQAAALLAAGWPLHVDLHSDRIRALYDRLDPALWEDDVWLVTGMAATYRGAVASDRRASIAYRSALDLLLTSDPPPSAPTRAAVLAHRAAGDRRVGRLAEARDSLDEARGILDTERGIPLQKRITLQARVALQHGLVLTHLGDFTAARDELRIAEGGASAISCCPTGWSAAARSPTSRTASARSRRRATSSCAPAGSSRHRGRIRPSPAAGSSRRRRSPPR